MKDKEQYLRRIREEFPHLHVHTAWFPKQGWDHVSLIVNNEIVFRFPRRKEYVRSFPKEIQFLNYLHHRTPIRIPHFTHIAQDQSFGAYPIIRGKALTGGLYRRSLMPAARKHIAKQLGEFLTILHGIPQTLARDAFGLEIVNTNHEYNQLWREYERFLSPKLSKRDRLDAERFLRDELPHTLSIPYGKTVLHGDLGTEHMYVDPSMHRLAGIIDFGDRCIGDPAHDFAGIWEYGRPFVESVFDLYKGKKDPQFLQRSLTYHKRIAFYMMIGSLKEGYDLFHSGYRFFRRTIGRTI